MPSRISQMRNELPRQMSKQQLNQSIEQVRGMMQKVKNAQNPQAMLASLLSNNPNTAMIANLLKNNGDLENLARQMANTNGVNLMQLVNQLQGGI